MLLGHIIMKNRHTRVSGLFILQALYTRKMKNIIKTVFMFSMYKLFKKAAFVEDF